MKILFFTPYFYPHIGGVEKHAFEVAKRLVEKGYEVNVICQKSSRNDKPKDTISKVKIFRINSGSDNWFKKFRIWIEIWRKRELIRTSDIVHCHDVFFWYLPFRFLYPRKKVYTTFHGYEGKYLPSWKAIFIRRITEVLSFGNITVGKYIAKWYGTDPTYVTYGAVSGIKNSRPEANQPLAEKLKILFIGRLDKDIGIETYLKALDALKKRNVKFTFSALGDGSLRKSVKRFGMVHGFVKNIKPYLKKADIIFASSYLSILESLGNKKLVLSVYDNPFKRDYLEMTPFKDWIGIKNSSDELALEIQKYLKNSNRYRKNIKNAYNWTKSQTWIKLTNVYLKLWKL